MSFKQIKLELDGAWVLAHRTADRLPINAFVNFCGEIYGDDMEIQNTSFTECTLILKIEDLDNDDLYIKINKILSQQLEIDVPADIAQITIEDVEAADNEPIIEEVNQEEKTNPNTDVNEVLHTFSAAASIIDTDNASTDEKIESLIGAEDFKTLVSEVKTIAPRIINRKTQEAFAFQSYLFSINDGCGLSTYLKLFADLIEENKLVVCGKKLRVIEEKLLPPGNDQYDPFAPVKSHLQGFGKDNGMLLCIDISEWMAKLTDKRFRNFLSYLEDHSAGKTFIFRIPFVEADVLDEINSALQDVFFIRPVSFLPMTADELTQCGKRFLTRFGFSAEEDIWQIFQARITEEKSDGRFYGINTVNKIIREMVYRKQLSDARNSRDDLNIKKEDIISLSKTYNCSIPDGMRALEKLVGMEKIKGNVEEIISQIELSRKNLNIGSPCLHMRFIGSPGTGKTTVARIIGRILKERGVLRNGNFFEYSGRDFCGKYVGETAPKTAAICRDAYGSVLFIDEAYSLFRGDDSGRDFGREALDTLIAEMENHRSDLVVIMAGYTDEMAQLMRGNTGLESRMPYVLEFPNYTREQLSEIYFRMLDGCFDYDDDFMAVVNEYFNLMSDDVLTAKDFSNARFVRNLFERTCAKAMMRNDFEKTGKYKFVKEDFRLASAESAFRALVEKRKKTRIGF